MEAPGDIVAKSMVIAELQDKADELEETAATYQQQSESLYSSAESCRERAKVLRAAIEQMRSTS